MRVFSQISEQRLKGLHPKLAACVRRALQASTVNFSVVQGLRTAEECYANFGKGRTAAECLKGGCPARYAQPGAAKVTWLNHALGSNHYAKDGVGRAVDLLPAPFDWKERAPFVAVRDA